MPIPRTRPDPAAPLDYDEPRRALLVEWADGTIHRIPFSALRRACPCAVCAGELGLPGRFAADPELGAGRSSSPTSAWWARTGSTPSGRTATRRASTFERLRELGERSGVP